MPPPVQRRPPSRAAIEPARPALRRGHAGPTEQANVVLGCTGLTATDDRRFALRVLNAVLGGGMSSRLFQEVREKRGLAYSVYSFASGYADAGYFGLYAGCAPRKVDEVLGLLRRRAGAAGRRRHLPTTSWPGRTGSCAAASCSAWRTPGRGCRGSARRSWSTGSIVGLDESLRRLRAVTADDVLTLAADLVSRPRCLAVVGPFDPDRQFPAAGL